MLQILKSKIHRAIVTAALPDYEGSIQIDNELLEAANILPYEAVHVWNVSRGTRLVTYAIEGKPGSGEVMLNGAAALLNSPNDIVIIASFIHLDEERAKSFIPTAVFVDGQNKITSVRKSR